MRTLVEPRVGVGVFVFKNNMLLMGQRIASHGEMAWSLPGGHLEYSETPESCAIREVYEETGIVVHEALRAGYSNDIFSEEEKHYITLFMVAKSYEGVPVLKEPEKCLSWVWVPIDSMPSPLFLPLENLFGDNPEPVLKRLIESIKND